MESVMNVSAVEAEQIDGQTFENNIIEAPATYEPPSPLTGCYLLIILGEPHSREHKDIILQRLLKGNSISNLNNSL